MALLATQGLSRHFGGVIAVDSLDLEVHPREILAIVGPNGSGKTTLFNLLSGFMKPTRGSIVFDGERIDGLSPVRLARRGLVRTFQQAMCFPGLSVRQNVEAAQLARGGNAGTTFDRAIALSGLSDHSGTRAGDLAYGLQRKLGVAIALAANPRVLMMDEPAAGVSDEASGDLARIIRTIRHEGGTVIVIDHDMPFILPIADRVIVLDAGKKLFEGTPAEVRRNKKVIEVYLGTEFE